MLWILNFNLFWSLSFPCFMTASKCHYVVSTLSRALFVALLHLVVPVFVAFYWLLLHHFTFVIVFYVCEYVFLLIIYLVVPVSVAFYWLLLHHFTFVIVFYVCEYVFLLVISALYLHFSYSASSDLSTVCVQTSLFTFMFLWAHPTYDQFTIIVKFNTRFRWRE
jgi:hypothetical protein